MDILTYSGGYNGCTGNLDLGDDIFTSIKPENIIDNIYLRYVTNGQERFIYYLSTLPDIFDMNGYDGGELIKLFRNSDVNIDAPMDDNGNSLIYL